VSGTQERGTGTWEKQEAARVTQAAAAPFSLIVSNGQWLGNSEGTNF